MVKSAYGRVLRRREAIFATRNLLSSCLVAFFLLRCNDGNVQAFQSVISPKSSRGIIPSAAPQCSVPATIGVTAETVTFPNTGLSMEVLSAKSLSSSSSGPDNILAAFSSFFWPNVRRKQPLVFIHGSFHSAWCWAEHFLPFFAAQGYDSYAISCRGTSPSPSPNQEASITINTHAADLRDFLRVAFPPSEQDTPQPILIGHSFGGAILLKLLEQPTPSPLRGVAFLCSVPPSGNGPMTARFLKRDFILALKIVLGFVAKKGAEWDWLCQELFFSPSLPPDLLRKYKERLKKDSVVGIDVKNFLKELPVLRADGATGQGRWVNEVPSRLVIGAERDKLVDKEGVEETARFVDAEPPVFLPTAHDAMLDPEWRLAANALLQWLNAMDQAVKK